MKHELTDIPGIGASTAMLLAGHGIDSVRALLKGGEKKLCKVPGFGEVRASRVLADAAALKDGGKAGAEEAKKAAKAEAKAVRQAEKEAKKVAKAEAKAVRQAEKEAKKAAKAGKQ